MNRKPIITKQASEDFTHSSLKPPVKVFEITKIDEGVIDVPPLGTNHPYNFKQGLYRWDFYSKMKKDNVTLKCGLFGEGIMSNAMTRYNGYRTVGKHLIRKLRRMEEGKERSNGSVVPIKCLNDLLDIGQSVSVYFYEVKNPSIKIDNALYTIHLASLEKEMKNWYKGTLCLD